MCGVRRRTYVADPGLLNGFRTFAPSSPGYERIYPTVILRPYDDYESNWDLKVSDRVGRPRGGTTTSRPGFFLFLGRRHGDWGIHSARVKMLRRSDTSVLIVYTREPCFHVCLRRIRPYAYGNADT